MWLQLTLQFVLLVWILEAATSTIQMPPLADLKKFYPGYLHYGGSYHNKLVYKMIGGNPRTHTKNTSPMRLSYALNRLGGKHSIGKTEIHLTHQGRDSFRGADGKQYIHHTVAFGPYLATKYGQPSTVRPIGKLHDHSVIMRPFEGKQGVVRLVNFNKKHAGGHVALWDCNGFYKTPDWTKLPYLIAVEFWQTSGSHCKHTPQPILADQLWQRLKEKLRRLNNLTPKH